MATRGGEDNSTHIRETECSPMAYCIFLSERKAYHLLFLFAEQVFLNEFLNDSALMPAPYFPANISLFIEDGSLQTVRTDRLR